MSAFADNVSALHFNQHIRGFIVKPKKIDEARQIFEGTGVKTTEEKRHLGAVIDSED